jgi:hypothetical protein
MQDSLGLILCTKAGYPVRDFSWHSSVPFGKFWDYSTFKTGLNHFLQHHSQFISAVIPPFDAM